MRFSPFVPRRRIGFGRRQHSMPEPPAIAGPDNEERRLIDRIMRIPGKRGPR